MIFFNEFIIFFYAKGEERGKRNGCRILGNVVTISAPSVLKPVCTGFLEDNVKNPGKSSPNGNGLFVDLLFDLFGDSSDFCEFLAVAERLIQKYFDKG